jgi:multimeric flavodoxin WrbA
MAKKILIISGSPKKNGNTQALIDEFIKGAKLKGAATEVVHAAFLKYKANGCTSCRACQRSDKYECAINDEAKPVLKRMADVDVIVMATPLYFFSASAQIKLIFDRIFSLYKWNNETGAMKTALKGKELVVIASSFEEEGLDALEAPFKITADYTGMPFRSLLVSGAGVSGDIMKRPDLLKRAYDLGKDIG